MRFILLMPKGDTAQSIGWCFCIPYSCVNCDSAPVLFERKVNLAEKRIRKMTKLTSLGDAPAKQQDQPLSGAGESFIGKISGPIEKPVRRQKTRRTENAQVKEEAAQQTVSETKETKPKRTRTAQNTDAHKKTTKTVKSAPNGEKAPAKTTKSTQTKNNKGRGSRTKQKSSVRAYFLGGLNEIGKNFTLFECENDMVIVDCGLAFPDEEMPGIDAVIPDFTFVEKNKDRIRGIVITHGHEDHIGAIPYVLREINVPIYSTKLTNGIIEHKLREHNMLTKVKRKVVKYGQHINLGCFRVEFIKTNHSIQDAAALAIYSPAGIIVHTGDFKVDYTPVFGDAIDLQRFGEIGRKGVLALMCDSTNAERPGFTMSEKTVGKTFDEIFADNKNHRIIIATFASNVDRVQQIINTAYKNGRKVVVEGRSMVNIIGIASELGYISIPDNTLIDIEELKRYPDEQTVIITTGSQGEAMAALSRMASGVHKKVTIKPNDTIVLSSNPIPGNEKAVSRIINELSMKGANVIFQDVHVSGHACQEEIKLIYSLVKPKYAIPVHGEYRHLIAQAKVAEELGIPKENIFLLSSGDVLELNDEAAAVTGRVHTGAIMVDGLGVGDVGNIVLRDRQHLAEDGIIIVVLTLEGGSGQVLAGPDIVSRGFVYVRGAEGLMDDAKHLLDDTMQHCMDKGITDWGKIKTEIKDSLGDFVWKETKRRPMIMPIIMEV